MLDDQAGCLYLPGRRQLDVSGPSTRVVPAPAALTGVKSLTVRTARARIKAALQAPLARHGFAMGEGGDTWSDFERRTPAGRQVIKIYRAREVWQRLFYCTLVPALPPEVAAAVAPARDIRLFVPAHTCLQAFPRFDYSRGFDCFVACSADALDRLLAAFLICIESQCLPALDACRTASDILDFDAASPHGLRLGDSAVLLGLNYLCRQEDMVSLMQRQANKSGQDRGRLRILTEVATRLSALRSSPGTARERS